MKQFCKVFAAVAMTAVLSGCGALGAAGRVACDAVAIIPDEVVALGAAVGGAVSGPTGAAAAQYSKTRPISRACHQVDEEVDLIHDLAPDAVEMNDGDGGEKSENTSGIPPFPAEAGTTARPAPMPPPLGLAPDRS